MSIDITDELVEKFLARLMEIEEKYAFTKKGQDTSRKDDIRDILEKVFS